MRAEEQYVERMKGVGDNEVEGETSRIIQRIEGDRDSSRVIEPINFQCLKLNY